MVLKTSDVKLPEGIEDIDDLNMYFEAQRKYNQKKDWEEATKIGQGVLLFFVLPIIIGVGLGNILLWILS